METTTIEKRRSSEVKLSITTRRDSIVYDDLNSSSYSSPNQSFLQRTYEDDPDDTMNSEFNITVIHMPAPNRNKSQEFNVSLKDLMGNDTAKREDNAQQNNIAENEKKDFSNENSSKESKDGSDSGVEGCAVEAQRLQSHDSLDYASSYNGLDEASCDSSLASCCSVYEDPCGSHLPDDLRISTSVTNGEGTSEAGSESSSLAGGSSSKTLAKTPLPKKKTSTTSLPHTITTTLKEFRSYKTSEVQKKIQKFSSMSASMTSSCTSTITSRARAAQHNKVNSNSTGGSTLTRSQSLVRERSRPREVAASKSITASTASSRSRSRPETRPSALTTEINKDLAQRGKTASAKPKVPPKARTRTPIDDTRRNLIQSNKTLFNKIDNKKVKLNSLENIKTIDTYATLPRASKHKFGAQKPPTDKPSISTRSRSGSRDVSLTRLTAKKSTAQKDFNAASNKSGLPPCPKQKLEKTKIYYEMSVQTGITGKELEEVLAGVITSLPNPQSIEKFEKETETEGSWEELQIVKADLKKLTEDANLTKKENEKLKSELEVLKHKLEEEKADHAFARAELDKNAERVLAMLGTPKGEQASGSDSFLELETQFQSSGQVVANQQVEISDLQSLCRMLSRDLEKSLAAQKLYAQQLQEMEAESAEIQDFLQEEKATLEIALKDAESEAKKKDEAIKQLASDLERQTEECKHLVRISEQRRQENLSLTMKLNAIERKTRELMLGQGASVSGASVALSSLANRLDGLVDQLIISYNISGKDLEDVIYHNEAFSQSNSSVDSSPVSSKYSMKDLPQSPKGGSFVSAVIGAIKNAATHPFASKQNNENKILDSNKSNRRDASLASSTDILDLEAEPCLMMESVLEDVQMPDTYSHNMISSCDSLRRVLSVPETLENLRNIKVNGESSSLSNLSQAILNRRKDEEEENCESISESEPPSEGFSQTDFTPATNLVDQVIEVDNLVTKLLKVLRIIQLDNDVCIQDLKEEKSNLETKLDVFLHDKKVADKTLKFIKKEKLTNGFSDGKNTNQNHNFKVDDAKDAKEYEVDENEDEKDSKSKSQDQSVASS